MNFGGTGEHLAIHVLTCVWHESLGAIPFNSIDFKQSIQYKAHHIRHFSSALTHPCNSPGNKVTAAANTGQRVSSDALKACEGSTFAERVVFLYLLRMGQDFKHFEPQKPKIGMQRYALVGQVRCAS